MIKGYEKYRTTDDDIIREIPTHWELSKFKFHVYVQNGFAFKSDLFSNEDGFPLLRIRDITSGEISTFYTGQYSSDYVVKSGDLLIGMDGDFNVRWWDNRDVLLNQRCCRILSNESVNKRYLFYYLPLLLKRINDLTYYTTVKHLSSDDINNSNLPFPPLSEQTQIAAFLDHKTDLIDALIAKKEALIEKLKLQRQAIINEAVTKGLDPKAKMKDSGIEWLGEIPEEWDLATLRYMTHKVGSGVTPKGGAEVYSDEGVIFVRSQNVHFEGLRLDDVSFVSEEIHNSMSGSKVLYNDVLLNITGASIGRCCKVDIDEEMNVNQHVCIIRPKENIDSDYLNFVLQSEIGQIQIKLGTTGGNREGLTFEAIKDFIIPIIPLNEQHSIVNFIRNSSSQLGTTISKILDQIQKLKHYRQSLISEAVTGKIDVREWKPKSKSSIG